ncbi:hypothetical protein GCM10028777_10360 [Angustibacter speluncae]
MTVWRALPAMASLLALLVAGCTAGGSTPDATLVTPTGDGPVTCQEHQTGPPGTDYAGGADADTAKVLGLLKYWKANGDKPFCDGREATEDDLAWANLVDRLLDDEPAPVPTSEPAPTTT